MILRSEYFYWLAGVILAITGVLILLDRTHTRRLGSGMFWLIFSALFLFSDRLAPPVVGAAVVVAALIAGFGGLGRGKPAPLPDAERNASVARLGNWLFVPALLVPIGTLIGSVALPKLKLDGLFVFDQSNPTLVALGLSVIVAVMVACRITRGTPVESMRQSRHLTESLGWALLLPQMLAVLGLMFGRAGVGEAAAWLTHTYVNTDFKLVAVIVYTFGAAIMTMIMGGAFAAFPVAMMAVGLPVLIHTYHGNPAVIAAIGMFSGYCGTLVTPMAAHFNIVPAALLELPDRYGVIRVQAMTAFPLLLANVVLLYLLM
ncbi:putative membrane protein [Burkholderia sp. Ch1-1]|uniref:Putative membrane protein n=1 Tax=Paraburkholderia dioscoreae TaxID=2604047 RepID=A0A5Q4ZIV7_9BURK|nr:MULTISPECIES: DUF979 domain-containing protein [Paraburkholderia]EIF34347.1 putative membrane protein [Burkholderia sp. Ch1-1]MDR8395214.1 DUF979 domain-containing protein [Paraburkholderia sp. USG1]VVD33283.1 putative membrane protein [Paraburkholderia dioscoreae]